MSNSFRLNVIANYAGSLWSALVSLMFVPSYVAYLGIEAYGLIGLFASLLAWLAILDLGLAATLNREMARFRGGAYSSEVIRDLLRSMETAYGVVAVLIAAALVYGAPWLAINWINAQSLPVENVAHALAITGVVIALRWMGGLYRSAMIGLQEHVWLNAATIVFATLRAGGAVAVLAFVSPTLQAFFIFQVGVALVETAVLAAMVYRYLPPSARPSRFSIEALARVWRFAGGVALVTILSVMLTQSDKILLAKLLPLADYGYYMVASLVVAGLAMLAGPIATAVGPKFASMVAQESYDNLAGVYHRSMQLISLALLPVTGVLVFFSHHILLLWTRDPVLADTAAPIMSLLAVGTALNALMGVPYTLQLAYGHTRLVTIVNLIGVVISVPALLIITPLWGAMGAAFLWVLLNLSYVLIALPLMHRTILRGHLLSWWTVDVGPAVAATFGILLVLRFGVAEANIETPLKDIAILGCIWVAATSVAIVSLPAGRELAGRAWHRAKNLNPSLRR